MYESTKVLICSFRYHTMTRILWYILAYHKSGSFRLLLIHFISLDATVSLPLPYLSSDSPRLSTVHVFSLVTSFPSLLSYIFCHCLWLTFVINVPVFSFATTFLSILLNVFSNELHPIRHYRTFLYVTHLVRLSLKRRRGKRLLYYIYVCVL